MIHDFKMIADASNNLFSAFRLTDQIAPAFIGYRVENETMYLYRYKPRTGYEKVHYFPFGIKSDVMAQFVWNWIEETRPNDKVPHTDGSVKKAFEFVTRNLDVLDEYYAIIKISVRWQVIGK